jgi:prepilin-type processing-associated H-X9-DG protein
LKQIALGFQNHHDVHKFFPTGGWGWNWLGDPDAGYDKNQPGGWVYNILAFIEQPAIRELGAGTTGTAKRAAIRQVTETHILALNCPSRRMPVLLPNNGGVAINGDRAPLVAKTDYAVNCGDQNRNEAGGDLSQSGGPPNANSFLDHTGISYPASMVTMADVLDGTAFTFCVGEKYLEVSRWQTGTDGADNECMYTGYNNDVFRSTHANFGQPRTDRSGVFQFTYGSAHPSGFNMSFCDGSVKVINFSVSLTIYGWLGNRKDGQALSAGSY